MAVTRRRATIADVAERAGVSIATVSKVLNARYGVSARTTQRVQAVIEELGYESSIVAQSLRSHRTNVIGIVVADIEAFSAELLKGAARALHDSGYELIVYSGGGQSREQAGWERRYLSRISGTLTDGTILVTPTVMNAVSSAPVVAVDPLAGPSDLPTVAADNLKGAMTATEYLLRLGHRRIGFLGGRPDLDSAKLRERGYRQALTAAGVRVEEELVVTGDYGEAAADEAARALLDQEPTAIFAANDLSAVRTMRVAADRGLRTPDDLSVIGFDDVPDAALATPALTTIRQPIQEMGFEAVRLLIGLIEGRVPGQPHLVLPTTLVERQSCRPY
ncbi:LacI family DNA-binding transcriptional regulator [Hamadaea tsunoensis]|uniref:LacI family DNA-binding transcriptional regulator n=1 Tax=Hamadaea tsunoensis TaxID=53368 RepID=UPI00040253CF|nr:LacI family DNA-binding transcriptional regulator [Hamadaea tsunoensis]